jgi:hypothetical protein
VRYDSVGPPLIMLIASVVLTVAVCVGSEAIGGVGFLVLDLSEFADKYKPGEDDDYEIDSVKDWVTISDNYTSTNDLEEMLIDAEYDKWNTDYDRIDTYREGFDLMRGLQTNRTLEIVILAGINICEHYNNVL